MNKILKGLLLFVLMAATTAVMGQEKEKTGVSLAGGGALGFAHIGFLQAMDEAGVKPDVITGSSMGAIIGVLYASGLQPKEIFRLVKEERMDNVMHLYRPNMRSKGGLVDTRWIQRIIEKYVGHNSFDSLKTKFYCCTSCMNDLQPHYVSSGGGLVQYVMASAAIPAVFAPVVIDSQYYFDGGLMDNMPVKPLLDEGCERRIGVNLLVEKPRKITKARRLWAHAFNYTCYATAMNNLPQFTETISIDPGEYWIDDFSRLDSLYAIGYREGKRHFGQAGQPQVMTGDLLFIGIPNSYSLDDMASAIADATGSDTSVNQIHVAILEVDEEDRIWAIDATIKYGVHRHLLDTLVEQFRLKDGSLPHYEVMRMKDNSRAAEWVANAKKFIGKKYDIYFLPDNDEYYCSELVQRAYTDKDGSFLFDSHPMNFLAADGTMPIYWTQLFELLGREVPQGVAGTNPNDMSHSPLLAHAGIDILKLLAR